MNKRVVITISRGGTARNILQNEFFAIIKKEAEAVLILTPAYNDDRFKKEFGGENVSFADLPGAPRTKIEQLACSLAMFLIYNKTTMKSSRYGVAGQSVKQWFYIKYLLYRIIFQPLSKLTFLRKILVRFDMKYLQKPLVAKYEHVLKNFSPDVLFCTSLSEDEDVAAVKAARNLGVKTVGMPKTWDNTSKYYFRARVDTVPVWAPFMKTQMMEYQDYPEEKLPMIGIPQFDNYAEKERLWSREKFCEMYGLDPRKKIIFFGSGGKVTPHDPEIVRHIETMIREGKLPVDAQVLVRPHYSYLGDEEKFAVFINENNVVNVDRFVERSNDFRDRWDYSVAHMDRFLNTLYHSDVGVVTASTLTLDVYAFDKPVILLNYDGDKVLPFYQSIARWYLTDYYSKILAHHSAPVVTSKDALQKALVEAMSHPEKGNKLRQEVFTEFACKCDGNAGKRLADIVLHT